MSVPPIKNVVMRAFRKMLACKIKYQQIVFAAVFIVGGCMNTAPDKEFVQYACELEANVYVSISFTDDTVITDDTTLRSVTMHIKDRFLKFDWFNEAGTIAFIGTGDMDEGYHLELSKQTIINNVPMRYLSVVNEHELGWPGMLNGQMELINMGTTIKMGYINKKCQHVIERNFQNIIDIQIRE